MAETTTVSGTRPTSGRPGGGDRLGPAGWLVRLALPVALLLWLLSLRDVQLLKMTDLGLLQVLPVLFWVALGLLTVGFAACLRGDRAERGWPLGYLLGLIAMVHATPSLLYPTLRYSWAWKHIAVIDAMLRHDGTVPNAQGLAIYNQWPGFFQLNALWLRVTGVHSATGLAVWFPPLLNALLIGPLLLLYRSVTYDRRLVWGALWVFFAASWVGQDYFSPQAFAFLLYVVVMAVVVRQLQAARAGPADPGETGETAGAGGSPPASASAPASAAGGSQALSASAEGGTHRFGWPPRLLLAVLLLEAAIVSSHQLTPLMLISAALLLSLPRRNRRVALPVLAGALVLTLLWDATVARPFVSTNLGDFVRALSSPDANLLGGVAGLGAAAPGQVLVAWIDRVMSAALFLLAFAGFLRRRWVRRTPVPLLVLAPLPLLAANNYGGEMIFRAYLFSLPATAFLTAALIFRTGPHRRRLRAAVAFGVMCALLCGLLFGYYSKERMNYFTVQEVNATRFVTEDTPAGSTIVSVTPNLPGGELHYDEHNRVILSQGTQAQKELLLTDPAAALTQADVGFPAYLLLTRSQASDAYLTGVLPADTVTRVEAAADASPLLTVVHRDADSVIYRYVTPGSGVTP